MKVTKLIAAAVGVALLMVGYFAKADDLGESARITRTTYTVPAGGTLTITNELGLTGAVEVWNVIEVSHVDPLTNNVFTVTRTTDASHGFVMWSNTHTNDSIAIEFAKARAIVKDDVIVFANSVTGAVSKVYVTKQIQ